MMTKPAVLSVLAAAGLIAACVPPEPPTVQDKCASAVSAQTGLAADAVTIEETIATAIGPKIYANAGGVSYSCQGDINGNITGVSLGV